MKVLLIASDYPPLKGGVSTVLERLRQGYSDHEISVMAPKLSEEVDETKTLRLELTHGRNRLLRFIQIFQWGIKALEVVRKEKIDLVLIGALSPLGVLGCFLRFFGKVPYALCAYSSEIPIRGISSSLRCAIGKSILEKASIILAISQYTEERIKAIAPKSRVTRIPLGIDSEHFRAIPKNPEWVSRLGLKDKKVLLCLGRLVRRKGIDKAIEALSIISQEREDVILLIAGDGMDRDYLKAQTRKQGVEEKVLFYGFVKNEDLLNIYALADVVLFLSREEGYDVEGFGLVALEAGACQKTVIAGRSGGIPDAVKEGQTGLWVDPTNVDAIVDAIKYLLANPDQAIAMGKEARAYAESRTWRSFQKVVRESLEAIHAKR